MTASQTVASRLADRLAALRDKYFVGRAAELELFRSALQQNPTEPAVSLFFVFGPGGVGKSVLLRQFGRLATAAGATVIALDGRDLEPSPAGFLSAVRAALGADESLSPLESLAAQRRPVLLIDTYEALTSLDTWLRELVLPQLPDQALVVLAGRDAPTVAWREDPAWSELARIVPLRNLPPSDSRAYLQARGISEAQQASVIAFTHGHPLALALVADVLAHGEHDSFSPMQASDVLQVLLARFIEQVPSPAHRRVLEVCARARVTTEALLADVLGMADAAALFGWLRGLSFIERGPEGLFPHDLAREVLDADLRWRDPESFADLHGRLLRSLVQQLQSRVGRDQQRAYFDLIYLSRHNRFIQAQYDWKSLGTTYAEAASPEDFPEILEMVLRHEGKASARIAEYWLGRRPEAFLAFRGAARQLDGFAAALVADEINAEDCSADPAVAAAWRFVQRHAPLRPGERLMHHRFWMSRDGYQNPAALNVAATVSGTRWLTTPRLAWSFILCASPQILGPGFVALGFSRAAEADFEVGEREYTVFAHDWRIQPPLAWIERRGLLEFSNEAPTAPDPGARAPMLVLSRPDFEEAVRQALRDFGRPDALAANPLLRSRLAAEHAGGAPNPATLQALLRDASSELRGSPKTEKLYRALACTYLEPAATHELAAERLGLPFNTYRYQLAAAIKRITDRLWQRELHADSL